MWWQRSPRCWSRAKAGGSSTSVSARSDRASSPSTPRAAATRAISPWPARANPRLYVSSVTPHRGAQSGNHLESLRCRTSIVFPDRRRIRSRDRRRLCRWPHIAGTQATTWDPATADNRRTTAARPRRKTSRLGTTRTGPETRGSTPWRPIVHRWSDIAEPNGLLRHLCQQVSRASPQRLRRKNPYYPRPVMITPFGIAAEWGRGHTS